MKIITSVKTQVVRILVIFGLHIFIDLEIHIVFINPSKIYKFSNFLGLVFTNPEVFLRIWVFVFFTKKSMQIHSNTL